MKKNVIFSILLSTVLICNLSADDLIFQDIQQKLDKKKINDVELAKVLETPSLFKNSTIRFNAKFTQVGKLSRVFHTKFDLSEYLNLAVWPDESRLWEVEGLKTLSPLLFVKKSSSIATVIGKLKKYQRIQITGLVTNDYQDQPWIEILAVKVLDKNALSEEALYHIRLGDKYHYGDHPVANSKEKPAITNIGISLSRAEIEYVKALEYELSDIEKSAVLELLGEVQLKQDKLNEAIKSLTETLNINHESGRSNYLMAMAHLEAGNLDQAKLFGEKALSLLSKDKEVLICNASILIQLKNFELAKHHCITALRLDDNDIRPYALLGVIYDAQNEYDVSKEMYRRAINLKEGVDNFDLHKNMAHELLKIALVEKNAKEKENALMQADRELNASIAQINDKDAEAFYLWGRILEEWKSRPKSEVDSVEKFDKAIALQPDYFNAHMHKANVLNYRMNKPLEAIASFEKASTIKPTDLSPLKSLEKIYRDSKNYEKTVSVNTRIVAIEPKNFGAIYALGLDNHLHLNLQAAAVDWFSKAVVLDPNHAEAQFYLGKALYLSGKKVESIKYLQASSVKLPGDKSVTYYLAKAYADTDQNAKAIELLIKYNAMDESNVETRVLLANEYIRSQKNSADAVKTGSDAVILAEKQKILLGASLDVSGWAIALSGDAQKALPILERANKEQKSNDAQYHLAYVYVQLNMYSEADASLKKLESAELDKKLAPEVKKLRADLANRTNKELELKKKASVESEVKVSQPEPSADKKVKDKEAEKKKADAEMAKEAEKNAKLEEKKRVDREKAKQVEKDNLAKAEKEKEKVAKEVAKEEAEKKKKADEKAKADQSKSAKAKGDGDKVAKEKSEKEKVAKEKSEKEAAAKKAKEDEKAKTEAAKLAKSKEEGDKAAKEKADKEKVAKEKSEKEAAAKKAKEDEKAKAEAAKLAKSKEEGDKAAKEKADKEKVAKEKSEKEAAAKKAKEDDKAKAEAAKLAKSKEEGDKAAKEKADKEKVAKEKSEKEAAAKKAKEDEKAKAEAAKLAKSKEEGDKAAKEKADKEKVAKEKSEKEAAAKKAKEDDKAKAEAAKLAKSKEEADKAAKEKADKEKVAKEKSEKEAAAKKAKEDEKAKAEEAKKAKDLAEKTKKEEAEKNKAALLKEKADKAESEKLAEEAAKKAAEDKKKKEADEKAKNASLDKQKAAERDAALKDAEIKKKQAEAASKERARLQEEAEKIDKQLKKEAEKK